MTFANGDKYSGNWSADQMQGQGELFAQNGDRYCGYFKNGMKHDFGVMNYANGDKYEGSWQQNLISGADVSYIYANGDRFKG